MRTLLCVVLLTTAVAAQQRSKDASGDVIAVHEADAAWAKAIAARSVEQTVACYDPEAVTAGSAMFPAQGLAAFRTQWQQMFTQPGFVLTWKLGRVVVLESGTMAYSSGTWKTRAGQGPYLAVWRKQPDGKWKVLVDAAWIVPAPAK